MRKFLLAFIAIAMVLAVMITTLGGCSNKVEKLTVEDFDIIDMNIGKNMPTWTEPNPVNEDMSTYEMFSTAIANYYDTDFVISQQYGTALTRVSAVKTSQVVDVARIRVGKGDSQGLNSNNALYYADSISYSSAASLYEKTIIKDDTIYYRNANTKYNRRNDTIDIKSWNGISTDFKNIEDYVSKKANNPTMIWMYDTSEENVVEYSDPIYDEDTKTYRFSLIFNPDKATTEYVKTMKQQLEANANMKVEKIEFLQLRIRVVLWENGMLRNMFITEAYNMKLGGLINSTVTLNTEVQFSYDSSEEGYSIANFEDMFYDSNALYIKPYGDSAADKLTMIKSMQQ